MRFNQFVPYGDFMLVSVEETEKGKAGIITGLSSQKQLKEGDGYLTVEKLGGAFEGDNSTDSPYHIEVGTCFKPTKEAMIEPMALKFADRPHFTFFLMTRNDIVGIVYPD
jgi:co-chaperonin GroES (HSP10)